MNVTVGGELSERQACASIFAGKDADSRKGIKLAKDEVEKALKAVQADLYVKDDALKRLIDNLIYAVQNSKIASKKEAAMLIAHLAQNSGSFQFKTEQYCVVNNGANMKGCMGAYGGNYYGRGYIQMATKGNYEAISKAVFKEEPDRLLKYPEMVAEDDCVNWRVAIAFWELNVHSVDGVKDGKFGRSIKAVNPPDCTVNTHKQNAVNRLAHYKKVLAAFGIDEKEADVSDCDNLK